MKTYFYDGPVKHFEQCLDEHYIAVTTAQSEKKAKNNLAYRYKIEHGYSRNAKIVLSGDLKSVS